MSALELQISNLQYVRVTAPDINGTARSKVIPARRATKHLGEKAGPTIVCLAPVFGPQNEIIIFDDQEKLDRSRYKP